MTIIQSCTGRTAAPLLILSSSAQQTATQPAVTSGTTPPAFMRCAGPSVVHPLSALAMQSNVGPVGVHFLDGVIKVNMAMDLLVFFKG